MKGFLLELEGFPLYPCGGLILNWNNLEMRYPTTPLGANRAKRCPTKSTAQPLVAVTQKLQKLQLKLCRMSF